VIVSDALDALLLRAFDSASTSLSLSDATGRILGGNQAFYKLFGYAPEDELSVAMLTRHDNRSWTDSYLQQLIDGHLDEFSTDKRFVHADGNEFDAHLTIRALRSDPDRGDRPDDVDPTGGDCIGMIATVTPTTLRPRVEDIRVSKLLEHAAGTLTLIDADGHVLETSGRYRATLGYPVEFWEERSIFDVLVPDDIERVLAMRDAVISEPDREVVGDFSVIGADRRIETLEVTATNLLHDPDVEGIVVTSHNVTQDRANTRAVSQLRDDAVAEAERRTNLLATVSHELRNPLHAMAGIAELLASDDSLFPHQHDLAATLQRQLLRLSTVTDDLLDTARLDVGEFRLRPTAIDIRKLIDDVMVPARSTSGDRLDVTATVADDVPRILFADATRLAQVIGNLVGNAVKFTERGSVGVEVTAADSQLVINVSDTGPGIADGSREDVFGAFTTLPSGGDRRGAGLGLAIVRRLLNAMEGTVALQSELGSGTCFTVTVPLVESERRATKRVPGAQPVVVPQPVTEPAPARRRTVLVVEDTPVNQDLARAQLDRLGIDSVIASSAEEGLELLEQRSFDAVLMDHQLPGMHGRDATREIRARGWTVPVVGVTASSTAADEQACIEAGMDVFLAKPVGLDGLRTALDSVWSDAHPAPAAPPTNEHGDRVGSSSSHEAAVDTAVLDVLVEELGDRSIVEQLVGSFLGELDARSSDIRGDDARLAARQAHTLKSSAAMLGATELAAACARAEREPEGRNDVGTLTEQVRSELTAWTRDQHDR
jgi:PAS domain S-box-containing protein